MKYAKCYCKGEEFRCILNKDIDAPLKFKNYLNNIWIEKSEGQWVHSSREYWEGWGYDLTELFPEEKDKGQLGDLFYNVVVYLLKSARTNPHGHNQDLYDKGFWYASTHEEAEKILKDYLNSCCGEGRARANNFFGFEEEQPEFDFITIQADVLSNRLSLGDSLYWYDDLESVISQKEINNLPFKATLKVFTIKD